MNKNTPATTYDIMRLKAHYDKQIGEATERREFINYYEINSAGFYVS